MSSNAPLLRATYLSPRQPFSHIFKHSIASTLDSAAVQAPPSANTKARTEYLAELIAKVTQLQSEINIFLTKRMEEDKRASEAQGQKISDREAKEEENYGEEVVDDDD